MIKIDREEYIYMAIRIHTGEDFYNRINEPYVVFWRVIKYYLYDLENTFVIRELYKADPYGEVHFDNSYCIMLQKELPTFKELVKQRILQEPSNYISDEWDDEYEGALTWEVLEAFINDLQVVIKVAINNHKGVIVIGD